MASRYKHKKKKYSGRGYRRQNRFSPRLHLPRWMKRRLLPVLILLFFAGILFPNQAQWLTDKGNACIIAPVCESVLEPYILEPADTHLLKPLQEHLLEPLEQQILSPINRFVLKPLRMHVLTPLNRHLLKPAGQLIQQRIWTPLYETVFGPVSKNVRELFETRLSWLPGFRISGSDSSGSIPDGAAPGSANFEIHFLDVGQGLSVLVKSDEHALLYDGGDRDTSSFVVSYLKQHGVTRLDYLIASHYDSDHLSGLIGVLRTIPVGTVIGPDYVHDSKTYTSFLNTVSAIQKTVTHPAVGNSYLLGDSYFTILSPQKIVSDANNNSVAIHLVNGDNTFLLTGDAETEEEEAMCRSGLDLYSDVICPGHHGSSNATSSLFLACTQPTWAVISVGAGNEYGHPHAETLQRLADAGIRVLRTDKSGTIVAHSDGATISWSTDR